MITIYLAHPLSGNVKANLERAKEWYAYFIRHYDVAVIADWIVTCEVLDDNLPADRKRGIAANHHLLPLSDEIWLCGHDITSGMRDEALLGLHLDKLVRWFYFIEIPEARVDLDTLPIWRKERLGTEEEKHRDKWLASQSAENLRKWIRKNSCLCDMAGLCSACALADAEAETKRFRKIATFLWNLLDDIDTEDDACKDRDAIFRERVRKHQQCRLLVGKSNDGHTVTFTDSVP